MELDLIESLMTLLVQARQSKSLLQRVKDLEAQRDHWKNQAAMLKQIADDLGSRLDFLFVNYIEGENDYFTFPDGTLYMTGERLKEKLAQKKIEQEKLDNSA